MIDNNNLHANTNVNARVVVNRFASHVLGGIDRVVDQAGDRVRDEFLSFLERFTESGTCLHHGNVIPTSELLSISDNLPMGGHHSNVNFGQDQPKYRQQVLDMRTEGRTTLYVEWNDLYRFNDVLATAIANNYYRFEPFLRAAIQRFISELIPSFARLSSSSHQYRDFWISISGLGVVHKLRELTCQKIGQLLSISGTITRTSEVKPELFMGTFKCQVCNTIIRGIIQQFKYTEPTRCANYACNNKMLWTLVVEQSVFVNWQKIRLQENSSEIPPGSMPRCIDVIVRNEEVERAKAGDKCEFVGCLIVVPEVGQLVNLPTTKMEAGTEGFSRKGSQGVVDGVTGLKALGIRDLTYKLSFLAVNVQPSHIPIHLSMLSEELLDEEDPAKLFTPMELSEIYQMKSTPGLLNKLVESIAPNIYAHSEIKTGLLLMLVGGIHKKTIEGINLRGDINICIVGDPGTAKSQFLRYVTSMLPRSVYTSGKASSAAGLTASVLKDEETGEFTIEAGALMLADNGICAIDEFDKMDLKDQIAIHEAMEQQTISIAKAGIQATLNARTSILAAANPIGGRYDRTKTLRQNIAMTAPILSRFDLFFVVLDQCDEQSDFSIARHILSVHRYREEASAPPYTIEQVQRYIKWSKTIKPIISAEAAACLVEKYKTMRQIDSNPGNGIGSFRMTVRQLESMIRLSEALARIHGDNQVRAEHVRDAARLIKSSLIRVEKENINLQLESHAHHRPTTINNESSTSMKNENNENMSISFEDYVRISNMLVFYLRNSERLYHDSLLHEGDQEERNGDQEEEEEEESSSSIVTKNQLIDWYLEQIEEQIDTEAAYHLNKNIIEAVIDRLIFKDMVLIELKNHIDEKQNDDNPFIVVHPNYVPN